jgi:hypothetical protein
VVKNGACNEENSSATKVTVNSCISQVSVKVNLSHIDPATNLMSTYYASTMGSNFPLADPYATTYSSAYTHVPSGQAVASTTAAVLAVTGPNAITDWVFVELRTGTSGATNAVYTRAGLIQADGDIVDTDGVSPLSFPLAPNGNYYLAIRHRNHLGFRTDAPIAISSANTVHDFTNNSIVLYGIAPLTTHLTATTLRVMNTGDANFDGSIDSSDSAIWEGQNGNFDDYYFNADYNYDGSVDSSDSALWETNNGKYEELQ